MAAVTQGTVYLYGVSITIASVAIQSLTRDESLDIAEYVNDENGRRVHWRGDDVEYAKTVECMYQSTYSVPTVGSTVSIDSVTHLITKVTRNEEARGFRRVSFDAVKPEYITIS